MVLGVADCVGGDEEAAELEVDEAGEGLVLSHSTSHWDVMQELEAAVVVPVAAERLEKESGVDVRGGGALDGGLHVVAELRGKALLELQAAVVAALNVTVLH